MHVLIQTKKNDSLYEKIRKVNTTEIYRPKDIPLLKELYEIQLPNLTKPRNIIEDTSVKLYQVADQILKKIPKNNTASDESKIAKLYLN